jgi:DNA-binding NarL/FixJ family response regulator
VCGDARRGIDAIRLASELKPDIVLLGLELADLNGIDAIYQIKRDLPSAEILLYTIHDEEYLIVEAFRAGARGHVLKSDSEETLIEAVKTLAEHRPFLSTKASETLLTRLLKIGTEAEETSALSDRELEITRLLAEGKSNKEIGTELELSVKTVESHRSAIMRKLGFKSITELVRYAIRNGLIRP